MYQSGDGVEHRLKSTELGHSKSSECCVAVVNTWHNQQHDQLLLFTVFIVAKLMALKTY